MISSVGKLQFRAPVAIYLRTPLSKKGREMAKVQMKCNVTRRCVMTMSLANTQQCNDVGLYDSIELRCTRDFTGQTVTASALTTALDQLEQYQYNAYFVHSAFYILSFNAVQSNDIFALLKQ